MYAWGEHQSYLQLLLIIHIGQLQSTSKQVFTQQASPLQLNYNDNLHSTIYATYDLY